MNTHAWMKIKKSTVIALMLTALSGCMSVGSGTPHPFTTLFQDYPPVAEPQHVMKTSSINVQPTVGLTAIQ